MANQVARLMFVLKMILGTILASAAGAFLASEAEYSDLALRSWVPGFIYTFFPLVCLVLIQWLLLSDYLPKWWLTLGILGSLIAGATIGIIYLSLPNEASSLYAETGFLALISGILAS